LPEQNKQVSLIKRKKSRWFWLGLALTLLALPTVAFSIYLGIFNFLYPPTEHFVEYIYFFSYLGYLPFTLGICLMIWGHLKKMFITAVKPKRKINTAQTTKEE
jgi:hypothetical protein